MPNYLSTKRIEQALEKIYEIEQKVSKLEGEIRTIIEERNLVISRELGAFRELLLQLQNTVESDKLSKMQSKVGALKYLDSE